MNRCVPGRSEVGGASRQRRRRRQSIGRKLETLRSKRDLGQARRRERKIP